MVACHRCVQCGEESKRSECETELDGLFGPELLCPRCGALVQSRLTVLGWAMVLAAAAAVGFAVYWLQGLA